MNLTDLKSGDLFTDQNNNRCIFIGNGAFASFSHESDLKILGKSFEIVERKDTMNHFIVAKQLYGTVWSFVKLTDENFFNLEKCQLGW